MKIVHASWWQRTLALTRPYTIAYRSISDVELFFVRLQDADGKVGLGSASPAQAVTGETPAACGQALAQGVVLLEQADIRHLGRLTRILSRELATAPAAQAALDMALHDLFARRLGIPLTDFLGRCHDDLPTSITIGIKPAAETLAEAGEYLRRGFTHLKVKLGHDFEEDQDRLIRLRQKVGRSIRIRVDANQGYSLAQTKRFGATLKDLDIEFVEQPLPVDQLEEMRGLPESLRQVLAADESLHTERDGVSLLQDPVAAGIWVIKLMKCSGITTAMALGRMARAGGVKLMWGCMDESVLSITAALHVAYASPATRYLDLDGSLDLIADPADPKNLFGMVTEAAVLAV